MKKVLLLILLSLIIGANTSAPTYAESKILTVQESQTSDQQKIQNFLNKLLKYSNDHNIEGFKNLYAHNYISGDGLKKDEIIELTNLTWQNYPNIKYISTVKQIRVNDNTATVESYDKVSGVSAQKSDITNDTGLLESDTHNILYLQRFGKDWKIISDKVDYEKTAIKYGCAKNLNFNFSAPEQVYSGESYTASLSTEVPEGLIALGSITREPIVYPQTKPEEVFRQISPDLGILERVFKANNTNNNELTAASVGITEMVEDNNANPDIRLSGIALLMQRVNVIPKSTYVPLPQKIQNTDLEPGEDLDSTETELEQENIEIDE